MPEILFIVKHGLIWRQIAEHHWGTQVSLIMVSTSGIGPCGFCICMVIQEKQMWLFVNRQCNRMERSYLSFVMISPAMKA